MSNLLAGRLYLIRLIAAEISRMSRYYDRLLQWKRLPHDHGELLSWVDCPEKENLLRQDLPDLSNERESRTMILLNGVFNHHLDIQGFLQGIHGKLSRTSRLTVVAYNPYLRLVYGLAGYMGIRQGEQPFTFLTKTDLLNLAKLSGFQVVRIRPCGYIPFELGGIGDFLNRFISILPIIRHLAWVSVITLKPIVRNRQMPSLSIVIPARNEKGNIEHALKRLPDITVDKLEIIFVEGHSDDGSWEEIQRVKELYKDQYHIQAFQQTGVGKNDAVRVGFKHATGELMTILDADLTMPPEKLTFFYDAYVKGVADFINGNRLCYPMEGGSMRFVNRLGNVFFAKALSNILDQPLGDSLCGTKLVARHDYERIVKWRKDFGDFDPFGDYELLFPAAVLGFGIVDIPIQYLARTYGSTNIHRFRHGLMLLKMTWIGLFNIRMSDKAVSDQH